MKPLENGGMLRLLALAWVVTLLGACASAPVLEIDRPEPGWEEEFEHPVVFQTLIDNHLLVVGTTRHLFGIEPFSGDRLWRLRNVVARAPDIIGVEGHPFILVNDTAGGRFDDAGTYVLAVDSVDGKILWESSVLRGRVLHGRLDNNTNILMVITVDKPHGDDSGFLSGLLPSKGFGSGLEREPHLTAVDMVDGSKIWERPLGIPVMMRPVASPRFDYGADGQRPFDLGLYHPPVISGNQVCVTYVGIRCYSINNGRLIWENNFEVLDDNLGLSYPNPVIGEGLVIAGGSRQIKGFDSHSGDLLWETKKLGRMPELLEDDSLVYAQLGGRYFDPNRERWVARGKFGAVALNKHSGNIVWQFDNARGSVSNLLVFGEHVWLADETRLLALQRETGEVRVSVPHKLKDPPAYLALNERAQVILISEAEAQGYDAEQGDFLWYVYHPAPKPGAWKRFSAGLLRASGTILKLSSTILAHGSGLLPSIPSLVVPIEGGVKLMSGRRLLRSSTRAAGRALADSGAIGAQNYGSMAGESQYYITTRDDEVILASVSLNSGQTQQLIKLPSSAANLVIDEYNGYAYQAFGENVVALPLGYEYKEDAVDDAEPSP